mmetsp:Transcript_13153/g.27835  ORF Transcript_13153/g.27835 Transcript_13153/m.27835 type:complete len:112 (+) Transcript_13153:757-1092(+)
MSRSKHVVDCRAENILWVDDSLGFSFPKSKTDQMGKNADSVWHVNATPHNPLTSHILALALYLFSNPGILTPVPTNDEDWNLLLTPTLDHQTFLVTGTQNYFLEEISMTVL